MEFVLQKNIDRTWSIVPTAGRFSGQVVATTEGANVFGARFSGASVIGCIRATWGLSIIVDDIYSDPDTFRALSIGRPFNCNPQQTVTLDRDGIKDSHTLRLLKGAARVLLLGVNIYTKGQY